MSVLYEHQTTHSCDGPHDLTERDIFTDKHTVQGVDGRWVVKEGAGWLQSCLRCGTVIEFRTLGEYPDPDVGKVTVSEPPPRRKKR